MNDTLTLADCSVPIPLRCMHCTRIFVLASPVEKFRGYVVVECLGCHCMTPFNLEAIA